jgi:hypothetical protein
VHAVEKPTMGWMEENEAEADEVWTRAFRRMASENRACNRNAMAKATLAIVELNDGAEISSTDGIVVCCSGDEPSCCLQCPAEFCSLERPLSETRHVERASEK